MENKNISEKSLENFFFDNMEIFDEMDNLKIVINSGVYYDEVVNYFSNVSINRKIIRYLDEIEEVKNNVENIYDDEKLFTKINNNQIIII